MDIGLKKKQKCIDIYFLFLKCSSHFVTRCHLGFNVHRVPWGAGQVAIPSITVIVWQGKVVVVMPVSGVHKKKTSCVGH